MESSVAAFLPIFVYLLVILAFAGGILFLTHVLGPRRMTATKSMPYESGMNPEGDARQHFDIRFYLVAILFLVFDVELLFLYPWAVSAYAAAGGVPAALSLVVFVTMLVFLLTLAIAYLYAWQKGVFAWR